jgi:Domain of unknown function (DUF5916)
MKSFMLLFIGLSINIIAYAQQMTERPKVDAKKVAKGIKIDGKLDEASWKQATPIKELIEFRPTPFKPEATTNRTETFVMYNNEGIYFGGKCYEQTMDSVTRELVGRDGFGNNDFIGISFDTYKDNQNGFEYFLTPLSEQFDAKISVNNNSDNGGEDFSWNAVWEGKCIIEKDGWSFEMFVPFSAIRFGKSKTQNWGINVFRRRIKTGQTFAWASINPQINGSLTQEGFWNGLTDIKPPLRLQFSPYVSYYATTFSKVQPGEKKVVQQFNGGMDVKYGINQAFTLDMALIPDFGQVQTDNRVLNLTPFAQQYNEQRPFFTEGTELFNKGDLFYSRRIGKEPTQIAGIYDAVDYNIETATKDPRETKIVNATKVSGRMQNGLAVGVLNAITLSQNAVIQNDVTKDERKIQTFPLTNYNVFVLDKTLKNNSSVSLVNTSMLRSGHAYDANITMALIDINDKTNTWNVGGKVGISSLQGVGILLNDGKITNEKTGYTQSIYFGKTSGKLNFSLYSDYTNTKFDKNDLGYQTNNNFFENGYYIGYNINKPKGWYNSLGGNVNGFYSRLASPIDRLKQGGHMFQEFANFINFYGQTKSLWRFHTNINYRVRSNDYYEPREYGRVFKRGARANVFFTISSNEAKKYSFSPEIGFQFGNQFKGTFNYFVGLGQKIRLNQKFSIEHNVNISKNENQAGFGKRDLLANIYFTRRNTSTVQNVIAAKYNFTNKMGITLNVRHYWSGVNPQEVFLLSADGNLEKTNTINISPRALAQNYNSFALNMVYTWQIANGSFLNIVWKDEADEFAGADFEKNYFKNVDRTFSVNNANTLSVKIIYFIDYLHLKKRK